MTRWWRRPSRAELIAEADAVRSDLAAMTVQRDALQLRIDDLHESLDQQRRDMRTARQAAVKAAIAEAYEPVQVGDCIKVRYTRREDAEQHAMEIALKSPGTIMNAYQCRICPRYRITGEKPWHAGTDQHKRSGSMWADETTLYHHCGCQFRINDDGYNYYCEAHRLPAESA